MVDALPRHAGLILRACANPDVDLSEQFDSLEAGAASKAIDLALSTRTIGLLDHSLKVCRVNVTPAARCSTLAKQAAIQNLAYGQAIVEVVASLNATGFYPVALKGSPLAFGYYPEPQMRPLRDVDLLLPPEQAEAAYDFLLLQEQFAPLRRGARYGLEHSHQLPEILHKPSRMVIEIHHRLNAKNWSADEQFAAKIMSEAISITLLDREVLVPTAENNFLHLLEHATLHHTFANGPLILADLHYLARHDNFDVGQVLSDIDKLGLARSFAIIVRCAEELGAKWIPNHYRGHRDIKPELVAAAMSSMLMNAEEIAQHDQYRRNQKRGGGFIDAALRVFKPDRLELAKKAGVSPDSFGRWLGYPKWAFEKGSRYLRGSLSAQNQSTFEARSKLADWLER